MDSHELSPTQVRPRHDRRGLLAYFLIALSATLLVIGGCKTATSTQGTGGYPITDASSEVPNLTLTDQYNRPMSLSSLRGKPVLFDFIYTSCPGPCQLLTSHMVQIAKQLGPSLGSSVWMVSVTVDPENDNPDRLLNYAKAEGANLKGWYFLTGSLPQIDQVMAAFGLRIARESDGSIDHVLEYFLVNPDGRPTIQYVRQVDPAEVARDAEAAAGNGGNGLISRLKSDFRDLI